MEYFVPTESLTGITELHWGNIENPLTENFTQTQSMISMYYLNHYQPYTLQTNH